MLIRLSFKVAQIRSKIILTSFKLRKKIWIASLFLILSQQLMVSEFLFAIFFYFFTFLLPHSLEYFTTVNVTVPHYLPFITWLHNLPENLLIHIIPLYEQTKYLDLALEALLYVVSLPQTLSPHLLVVFISKYAIW